MYFARSINGPFEGNGRVAGYRLFQEEATMPLQIRRGTPDDAPQVIEFNRRLALETEGKTLDADVLARGVAAGLADPDKARYFLAEDEGAVLGQMMITSEWSDWRNGWIWWIQSVYVGDNARRRGVFRALYEHVYLAACREPFVIGLRLYVERDNVAAQQTYARLGMERTSYLVFEKHPLCHEPAEDLV
jgi:ribosomal protein S18 acetylase RimI-like enzyme